MAGREGRVHRVLGIPPSSAPSYIRTRRRPNTPRHAQRASRPSGFVFGPVRARVRTWDVRVCVRVRDPAAMGAGAVPSPERRVDVCSLFANRVLRFSDARTRRVASRHPTPDVVPPPARRAASAATLQRCRRRGDLEARCSLLDVRRDATTHVRVPCTLYPPILPDSAVQYWKNIFRSSLSVCVRANPTCNPTCYDLGAYIPGRARPQPLALPNRYP